MKAERRKKLILENAKKLFSKKGYYNTQISDIVNEVKVARGTVYQYFKNKDEIFLTLLKDFYDGWERYTSIEIHKIDLKIISPMEYFYLRVKYTLEVLAKDRHLCNIFLRMGIGLNGKLESTIRRFEKKINKHIVNDLNLGIRNNHLRKNLNIEMTANLITGALLRTALYDFVYKNKKRDIHEIEKLAREFTGILAPALFVDRLIDRPSMPTREKNNLSANVV